MRREKPRELQVASIEELDATVAIYRSRGYALVYRRGGSAVVGRAKQIDMRVLFAAWVYGGLVAAAYTVFQAWKPDRDLVEIRVMPAPLRAPPLPQ